MSPTFFGIQVANQRDRLALTQAELAELSQVSLRTIRAIEAGRANPGLQLVNQVLDKLGLELAVIKKS